MNRGKLALSQLAEEAISSSHDRIILIERWKGGPRKIVFYNVESTLKIQFPIVHLSSVRLQRELNQNLRMKKIIGSIITEDSSTEIQLLAKTMTEFLQIPLYEEQDAIRNEIYMKFQNTIGNVAEITFLELLPNKNEIGPRLLVRKLDWVNREHTK